jgi:ABC-type transport system involved in cytochrome bd biosynthesis fused ATPase/permease subunit
MARFSLEDINITVKKG